MNVWHKLAENSICNLFLAGLSPGYAVYCTDLHMEKQALGYNYIHMLAKLGPFGAFLIIRGHTKKNYQKWVRIEWIWVKMRCVGYIKAVKLDRKGMPVTCKTSPTH